MTHVRGGGSRSVVVSGEAGIGKTALLDFVAHHANGCTVVRVDGVESEMELAYAGLHQLCAPLLDLLDLIPEPQRDAIGTAFGLTGGRAPDPFLVGLAVLSLLSEASSARPVICLVDDVQWLDETTKAALAFVARRLREDAVGIVFGERDGDDDTALPGVPRLVVEGLPDVSARALLASTLTGPLDERVRERIVAETRGNPLALLQVPFGLKSDEVAGGFGLSGLGALTGRIEQSFRRRLAPMPAATRRLLVVAAAEPGQDAVLIWRAAARLGVGPDDAEPASADGFASFAGLVRFCHPLARSTVYKAAPPDERRAAHQALADATDPAVDPERRAWHRAQAASGLDEEVAAELERTAMLAQARGGCPASAAFLERAAELTPDPALRAERAVAAATAKYEAGAPERALRLLAIAEAGTPDEPLGAQAQLVRARIMSRLRPGDGAPLLAAAARLEPIDHALARETYRDAFYASHIAGRLAEHRMEAVAAATRRSSRSADPIENPFDRILQGVAAVVAEGYRAGAPMVLDGLASLSPTDLASAQAPRWLPFTCLVSFAVWDDDSARKLSTLTIDYARGNGVLSMLHTALMLGAGCRLFEGDIAGAEALSDECELIGEATTIPKPPYGVLMVAAWKGREVDVERVIAEATPFAVERGEGQWLTATGWAEAVLYNGLGRYDRALEAAARGGEHASELALANWALVELVEAAVRSGQPERAIDANRRLSEMAEACGTDWIVGVAARSRALLADGDPAESDYRLAIDRLARTPLRSELARARLLYGEWLRRERRRVDAREQLRAAHDVFDEIGADAFAERTRRELAATGETVHRRAPGAQVELTRQEAQIARLASEGQTNPEIATQLFVSPRTVEWHLRKVFGKLDIASRRELGEALKKADAVAAV
ncbi:helix-turn-helix transcriptional regulator [Agromyces protaetiae]|uniref:helix-turn-helix transcriptional regulator n=1 Tax=Agromyces protaetiae TaxID=2509455 RepID=UPI001FB60945|nr:LuxR family transcriptional regulator [Agromyces protaetiae]